MHIHLFQELKQTMTQAFDFPVSTLQSFNSLSVSPTTIDFGKDFAANKTPQQFLSAANQFLQLHSSSHKVEKFNLCFYPLAKFLPDIESLLAYAVRRGVEEVNLDFSMKIDETINDELLFFPVPTNLSDCTTLTKLSLSGCDFMSFPDFAGIISNCVVLDSLFITDCSAGYTVVFSSKSLRKLTIVNPNFGIYYIAINAPKLESFIYYGGHVFGHRYREYPDAFIDISSLSDAFICAVDSCEAEHDFIKVVYDLKQVKILTVCMYTLWCVGFWDDDGKFPILLQNLKELQLLISGGDLSYIYSFFRNCPSPFIEKLFIQLSSYSGNLEQPYVEEKVEDLPDINFNHLKVIKLSNFKGSKGEMRLVGFLLQKAVNLEYMVLLAPPNSATESMEIEQSNIPESESLKINDLMSLRSQLSLFPKASPRTSVLLCEHSEDDMSVVPTHTEYFGEY